MKGIYRKFLLIMSLMSSILVLLWILSYALTSVFIEQNVRERAESVSETIMSGMEEKLVTMEDAAYVLAQDEEIGRMAVTGNPREFCDMGAAYIDKTHMLSGLSTDDDNVIVYNGDGLYYRLKGNIPNTALSRAFHIIQSGDSRTLAISYNDITYIGTYEQIGRDNGSGYVVILAGQPMIDRMLGRYDELDYLGVALLSSDRLLCANTDIRYEDIEKVKKESLFVKEKNIGLSGFRILIYCERDMAKWLRVYFGMAIPVTVIIMLIVVVFVMRYLRRHMIDPVNGMLYEIEAKAHELELEKERNLLMLLKKQISAHFTVNTLNVVRALVNKGEREKASRICDELSVLLRYANAGDGYISLGDELYVLRQYTGIMQIRYPDRIEVEMPENTAEYADIKIPRMLLQPLMENAIVHGLAGKKGKIKITAAIAGQDLVIQLGDDGKGMTKEKLEEVRNVLRNADEAAESGTLEGMAIKNIQKRIHMVCGNEYGLRIESEAGKGTAVYIKLPIG